MSEEKKEPWLNWLALSTIIIAVCATMATFKGGGYSTRSILFQSQASDQWAFFQAKSLKMSLAENQKDAYEDQLESAGPAGKDRIQSRLDSLNVKISRYNAEKNSLSAEAKNLEHMRDDAQKHGKPFGLAVIFLQVAILLSSISALLKKKFLWYGGMVVGVVGIVHFLDGFFLFF